MTQQDTLTEDAAADARPQAPVGELAQAYYESWGHLPAEDQRKLFLLTTWQLTIRERQAVWQLMEKMAATSD